MSTGDSKKLSGLDGLFGNTNFIILLVFALICNFIAFILGIIGWIACKDPTAKRNAMYVCLLSLIAPVIYWALSAAGIIGSR
jgi:hypothetical protein